MPAGKWPKTNIFAFDISASFTIQHTALKNTTFRGFNIPTHAQLIGNIYAAHMDGKVFRDPTQFRPSRFITDSGQLIKDDSVIPFGMGK